MSSNHTASRSLLLDIFRIILCLGVVVYHYTPDRPGSGPFMVLGFFVMSGFLLGLYFDKNQQFNVEQFYIKKAQRLLPLFITALILGGILRFTGEYLFTGRLSLLPDFNTTEWTNCNLARLITHYNVPLWFMIVELNMLICAPLFFVLYNTRWRIGILLVCAISFSLILYSQLTVKPSLFADNLYYLTLYRAYQFIAGICAAKIFCHIQKACSTESCINIRKKWHYVKNMATGFLFGTFIIISIIFMICKQNKDLHFFNYSITFDIICVIFYCILIPLLYCYSINPRNNFATCIGYISVLTYPMYLVHVIMYKPILLLFDKYAHTCPNLIPAAGAFIVSLSVSTVLLHLQNKYFRTNK